MQKFQKTNSCIVLFPVTCSLKIAPVGDGTLTRIDVQTCRMQIGDGTLNRRQMSRNRDIDEPALFLIKRGGLDVDEHIEISAETIQNG